MNLQPQGTSLEFGKFSFRMFFRSLLLLTFTRPITQTVQFSDLTCSSESKPKPITLYSGTLYSPSYPSNYPNNALCIWVIQASQPYRWVTLDFSEFYIEPKNDYVIIYNGASNTDEVLIRLDGYFYPPLRGITTTNSHMRIMFKSDYRITYSGFKAKFTLTSQEFIPTRLVDGTSQEGRLEVNWFGKWHLVCNRYFDDVDAKVACYGLGYGYVGRYIGNEYAGYGNSSFFYSELQCKGNETSIAQCPKTSSINETHCSSRYNSVSISCTTISSADSEQNWPVVLTAVVVTISIICIIVVVKLLHACIVRRFHRIRMDNSSREAPDQIEPAVVGTSTECFDTSRGSNIGFQTCEVPTAPAFDVTSTNQEPDEPPAYYSLCQVCFAKACGNIAMKPCGHFAFCNECVTVLIAERLQCPICHQRSEESIPNSRY